MLKGFITNLGKYNEGELVGEWIDFPIDEEKLEKVFERIGISDEPDENGIYYEEYFFTDWECDIATGLGEYVNIEEVNDLAERLAECDEDIIGALGEYGYELEKALNKHDDVVFYHNMTLLDVAYQIVEECYNLPEIAERYFDYEAFARDLGFDGYYEARNGVILID